MNADSALAVEGDPRRTAFILVAYIEKQTLGRRYNTEAEVSLEQSNTTFSFTHWKCYEMFAMRAATPPPGMACRMCHIMY